MGVGRKCILISMKEFVYFSGEYVCGMELYMYTYIHVWNGAVHVHIHTCVWNGAVHVHIHT